MTNYLTTQQAAQLLGVSVRTVQQWVEKGRFKSWRTAGGHRRICRDSVNQYCIEKDLDETNDSRQSALRVLVVDDNESLLKLYRLRLSAWSFPVLIDTAANGYEALIMMGDIAPDLIVLDLRLPGISGFQIIRAIAQMERFHDARVVVVSGMANREIDAHGGFPKPIDVMSKPIDFVRLQNIGLAKWSEKYCLGKGGSAH